MDKAGVPVSRPLFEVIVELIAANYLTSAVTTLAAIGQLVLALRAQKTKAELARLVTWSTSLAATTISLAVRVYEPIGSATPAPQVGVYAYVLVYSLGPILIASAATALEGIIHLFRTRGGHA